VVETGGKKFLLWYCHLMGRPRPLLKNYAISLPLASGTYTIYYYQFQCFPSLRIFWRTDNSTVARVNVNPFHPITRDPSSAARPSRTRQCQRRNDCCERGKKRLELSVRPRIVFLQQKAIIVSIPFADGPSFQTMRERTNYHVCAFVDA